MKDPREEQLRTARKEFDTADEKLTILTHWILVKDSLNRENNQILSNVKTLEETTQWWAKQHTRNRQMVELLEKLIRREM